MNPTDKKKFLKGKIVPEQVKFIHFNQLKNHTILDTFMFGRTDENQGYGIILDNQSIYLYFSTIDFEAESRDELYYYENQSLTRGQFIHMITNNHNFYNSILEKLDTHNIIDLDALNEYKKYINEQLEQDKQKQRDKYEYEQYLKLKNKFEK